MVRARYEWNSIHIDAYFETLFETSHRNSWPNVSGIKMTKIGDDWIIDWRRFFELDGLFSGPPTNRAKTIDTRLELPLSTLPEHFHNPDAPKGPTFNLAHTTLARQRTLQMRSAQEAIALMNPLLGSHAITPLTTAELVGTDTDRVKVFLDFPDLVENTPIWFYVLREAEVSGINGSLGPMGSRLVMETVHAAIEAAEFSILATPGWQPSLPRSNSGNFTMPDLILFSANPSPIP
jgi:hypothetical protein